MTDTGLSTLEINITRRNAMHWEKRQKFSIRKFSIGAASVLIGQFFVGQNLGDQVVAADEVAGLVEESSPVSSESSPSAVDNVATDIESANIGGGYL